MVDYRAIIAAGARALVATGVGQSALFRRDALGRTDGVAMALSTGPLRQVEQRVPPIPTKDQERHLRRHVGNAGRVGWQGRQAHMVDSTVIRAHHCAVGLKKGLKIKRGSAARAAASRPRSTPDAMATDARLASSWRPDKRTTIKASCRFYA